MTKPQSEGARLLSLALRCGEPASKAPGSKMDRLGRKLASESRSEVDSFEFSFWLGVALLLQGRPCTPGVVGSFKRVLSTCQNEVDLLGFIGCCSQVREVLTTHGRWERGLFKDLHNRWLRGLLTAIETAVNTSLCVHPSRTFDDVVTFLGWLKRLPVAIRPEKISIEAYLACEARLASIDFDANVYLPQLQAIWREWFGNFRLQAPFRPKHGSGSTADSGKVLSTKWKNLSIDTVADVCMRYPNLEKVLDIPVRNPKRVAKVVFVPKQAGKDRTICMEPAWLQFLQQGIARQLVDFTHFRHPLSQIINVFDQDNNRSLCSRAEYEGLATIDLSDASDSVSYELMKRLTRGLPLARYYHASRSHSANIRGTVYPLVKFAPMGSALCFINECFVFASVVELAYRIHFGKASRGHHSGVSVYGDDIICPKEIYDLVVTILTSLGFLVNESKSFCSGSYYESCGVEYLYGALITTIKHPRAHLLQRGKTVSPDLIGTVTDLANSLHAGGYFLARRILLKKFSKYSIRLGNRLLPFDRVLRFDGKGVIPIHESYAATRWDANLQRAVRVQLDLRATQLRGTMDYHHFQWMMPEPRAAVDYPKQVVVSAKWSDKAITCLARFRHWDLLRTGDLCETGSCKTGRLRYVLTYKKVGT